MTAQWIKRAKQVLPAGSLGNFVGVPELLDALFIDTAIVDYRTTLSASNNTSKILNRALRHTVF